MALIVEDGTGLATAESYVSVADASARRAAMGDTNWADLTTTEMEEALRRATVYMEQSYRERWKGYRLNSQQALSWPRYWVIVDGFDISSDIVPPDVANACADMAFRAAADDLAPDIERAIVREKVGPLETEYDRFGSQAKKYRAIDMMLSPFLKGASAMAMLVRT